MLEFFIEITREKILCWLLANDLHAYRVSINLPVLQASTLGYPVDVTKTTIEDTGNIVQSLFIKYTQVGAQLLRSVLQGSLSTSLLL